MKEEYSCYNTPMNTSILITIVSIIAAGLLATFTVFLLRRGKRVRPSDIDLMEGHDFEYYCAELLKQHGFQEVEVTRGSGDYGIDILAEKEGVTYAIQCKCYAAPVGVKAVQEAYAGRDYYDRMVGAVLTNQYFTQPAVEAAKKLKILLWDRGYLESMIDEK
ncbi:MAG: restriction endonuclease [Acetatifactor sp.]